jgi:hypothetical protein
MCKAYHWKGYPWELYLEMGIVTLSHWNINGHASSSTKIATLKSVEELYVRFESLVMHLITSATEKITYASQMISLIAHEEYAKICWH